MFKCYRTVTELKRELNVGSRDSEYKTTGEDDVLTVKGCELFEIPVCSRGVRKVRI